MVEIERVTTWSNTQVLTLIRREFDADVTEASWIGSGHWSDCFSFASTGIDHVVRIGHQVEDFRNDQAAARHRKPGLPIPAVVKIGRTGDAWFAISERVYGVALEQAQNWGDLVHGVADLLEGLRTADIAATSGWGHWTNAEIGSSHSWRSFLLEVDQDPPEGRTHGWKAKLARHPNLVGAFALWYERLQQIAPAIVPRSLVHNDLLHRNTHVAEGSITGVFDWGNALYGDHLYDLAHFCFWEPWLPPVQPEALLAELNRRWHLSGHDVPDFANRFEACLLHIALEHIGYHAFLENWSEANAVADRMNTIASIDWLQDL